MQEGPTDLWASSTMTQAPCWAARRQMSAKGATSPSIEYTASTTTNTSPPPGLPASPRPLCDDDDNSCSLAARSDRQLWRNGTGV